MKTRAWIIQCAMPVFAEHGPDAPVIDQFIRAAEISRGTFYNYFQTTRELLEATIATMSDEVIASIVPAVAHVSDPLLRLALAARLYYRKATHDPMFRAFLTSVSGVGMLAMEHIRDDLQEAIDADLMKVRDVELAQAIAVGVMVFALKTPAAQLGDDAHGADVVRAILGGLGVSAARMDRALRQPLPELVATA